MRSVQAKQVAPFAGTLASGVCCVCGNRGIQVLASGTNDNGGVERFYCSIDPCARKEGWPWIGDAWKRAS